MNIDWLLLKRSINSRLNETEMQALEEWLKESPEHRDLYRNIKAFMAASEGFRPDEERLAGFKADYEKRLGQIQQKRRRPNLSWTIGIAASLLLSLGITLFIFSGSRQEKNVETARALPEILPGSRKAVLVTGEGKTVFLNRDSVITEVVSGVRIKNDANTLVYSDTDDEAGIDSENQLIIPRGGEYSVRLSDGTTVWLNSGTELKYPVRFSGRQRRVYLKGEAYFQVAHNAKQAFIVATDDIEVKVYGTEFNINTRVLNSVQTTLVNGSVAIRCGDGEEQFLKPDQMARYDRESGELDIKTVDVANYISWKSGIYIFENLTIEQIMEELSLWYDVDVFFRSNLSRFQRFSGSLPRYHDISEMLTVIEKTSHVSFVIKGKTIVVE